MAFDTISRMRIEAPTAVRAFALEDDLRHLRAVTVGRRDRWFVELNEVDGHEEEVLATVRHWLREMEQPSTAVWVDGAMRTVNATVPPEPDLLGVGYDGRVLEHEP